MPQHLRERFRDMQGVMIDERGAAVLSAGQFGSIFMADSSAIVLFPRAALRRFASSESPSQR